MISLSVPHGTVHTDDAVRSAMARDFGGLVRHLPLVVVRPGSVEDVMAAVRWATANQVPLVARGTGHSMNGQSQVADGVLLDMTALSGVHEVTADRAVVSAGTSWSTLLAATLPRGLAPPVLTDYPATTVGGTLSTGGIGGMSHRHGAQTDNVLELAVVTPDGRLVTCSPAADPGLFDAVRAGLGRHGVLVRATVALTTAPGVVRRYRISAPDTRTFTAGLRRLVDDGRFDYVTGFAKVTGAGPRFEIEVVSRGAEPEAVAEVEDLAYGLFLDRLAPAVAARRATGDWDRPHPWLNVFIPDSAADDLLDRVLADLTPADLGEFGFVLTCPIRTATMRTPQLRVPAERLTFLLALLLTASTDDQLARITERNERVFERVRRAGGHLYPIGPPDQRPSTR